MKRKQTVYYNVGLCYCLLVSGVKTGLQVGLYVYLTGIAFRLAVIVCAGGFLLSKVLLVWIADDLGN